MIKVHDKTMKTSSCHVILQKPKKAVISCMNECGLLCFVHRIRVFIITFSILVNQIAQLWG